MKTGKGLVEYAKAQIGLPYWWGTFGNIASQDLLDYKKKQYPEEYSKSMYENAYQQFGYRVHDCVGLIKGYLWSDSPTAIPKYNASQDVNVTGMFLRCTETGGINSIPEIPGLLLFNAELTHVGVYVGNKTSIDARGHLYGVVESNMMLRDWKLWGKLSYLNYGDTPIISGCMPTIQRGDVGDAVKILQMLLNYHGETLEDDGEFGPKTDAAVKRWQRSKKLTVNGVCNKDIWISLVS